MSDLISLYCPHEVYNGILAHLLSDTESEQAAFGYARYEYTDKEHRFDLSEWRPVKRDEFEVQTEYYMELTDVARADAIKRAHDLGVSLVEFHSHVGPWPAAFSQSDWSGFDEFVPHVWWRLKGRAYLAIVVAASGFDGISWILGPDQPQHLTRIVAGDEAVMPTGLTTVPR